MHAALSSSARVRAGALTSIVVSANHRLHLDIAPRREQALGSRGPKQPTPACAVRSPDQQAGDIVACVRTRAAPRWPRSRRAARSPQQPSSAARRQDGDTAVALGFGQADQVRRFDIHHQPLGIEAIGQALARSHQPLGLCIGSHGHEESFARARPRRRAPIFVTIRPHRLIDADRRSCAAPSRATRSDCPCGRNSAAPPEPCRPRRRGPRAGAASDRRAAGRPASPRRPNRTRDPARSQAGAHRLSG